MQLALNGFSKVQLSDAYNFSYIEANLITFVNQLTLCGFDIDYKFVKEKLNITNYNESIQNDIKDEHNFKNLLQKIKKHDINIYSHLNDIMFDAKKILDKVNQISDQIDLITHSLKVVYQNISIIEGDEEAKNYFAKYSSSNQTFKNRVESCINLCTTKNIKMDQKVINDLEFFLKNYTRNYDAASFAEMKEQLEKVSKKLI